MRIDLSELRRVLKSSGLQVYRDDAPTTAKYPYVVYDYIEEPHRKSSNRVFKYMPTYQVAVITNGTEEDYKPLRNALESNGIPFSGFEVSYYDENDFNVVQYTTIVRCIDE